MNRDEETRKTLDIITETFGTFRAEMESVDKIAFKIGRRTTRLIRVVLTILAISSTIVLFLVADLTSSLTQMIDSMNAMYNHFGYMSKDMNDITASVNNMGQNIQGIPVIAEAMKQMNHDVAGMDGAVVGMKDNMQSMEQGIVQIDRGVWEMSGRFNSVTMAVSHMNYNVNQMTRPTNMMNPMGWMIPP
ncbi:MAG: hypothetical protein HQL60_06340 [Magnetococcales bacterium]|nr:hypothetical protein [Magnetococcales bacterium]